MSFTRGRSGLVAALAVLSLAAGIETGTVGHDASRVILTGSGSKGKNASIDQFLAVARRPDRPDPRLHL